MNRRKIVVAVTGASGTLYARLLLERLLRSGQVERIAVIVSERGRQVAEFVRCALPLSDRRIEVCRNDDLFAGPASGSAGYDAMAVVPCSMGCVGRIAAGISSDLIARAADVMLKERRPLVLVPREAPFGTLHLRNMTSLSECGAVIVPACPSFYSHPEDIEALCMTVVERIAAHLGIDDLPRYEWPGRQEGR